MGIDFAPNNANVFMGHWEETFIYDVQKITYFQNITLWKRYIDDILLVWNGTEGLLSELISYNLSETNLKFTTERREENRLGVYYLLQAAQTVTTPYTISRTYW